MDLVPDLVSDADRCTLKSSLRKPSLMGHVQIGVRASSLGVCEYGIAHLRFILHHVGWFFNRVSKIPYSLPRKWRLFLLITSVLLPLLSKQSRKEAEGSAGDGPDVAHPEEQFPVTDGFHWTDLSELPEEDSCCNEPNEP